MSIVTYRGVKYDTDAQKAKATETKMLQEVYRGIKHTESKEVSK